MRYRFPKKFAFLEFRQTIKTSNNVVFFISFNVFAHFVIRLWLRGRSKMTSRNFEHFFTPPLSPPSPRFLLFSPNTVVTKFPSLRPWRHLWTSTYYVRFLKKIISLTFFFFLGSAYCSTRYHSHRRGPESRRRKITRHFVLQKKWYEISWDKLRRCLKEFITYSEFQGFLGRFWPLLTRASFFEVAGAVSKTG